MSSAQSSCRLIRLYCRAYGDYIRWGIGLTTGFIGSQVSYTLGYSVLHFTTHYNRVSSVPLKIPAPTLQPTLMASLAITHYLITRRNSVPCQSHITTDDQSVKSKSKHRLRFFYCCMTSLPEQTPKKTPIVESCRLPSNGFKQTLLCLSTFTTCETSFLCSLILCPSAPRSGRLCQLHLMWHILNRWMFASTET
jgi:hypothetical protein